MKLKLIALAIALLGFGLTFVYDHDSGFGHEYVWLQNFIDSGFGASLFTILNPGIVILAALDLALSKFKIYFGGSEIENVVFTLLFIFINFSVWYFFLKLFSRVGVFSHLRRRR